MSRNSPWRDLGTPVTSGMTARRVDDSLRHDFYWACNREGRYAFILQMPDDMGDWDKLPDLHGVSIHYYPAHRQFQLTLNERTDWEMFLVLCQDLIQASDNCSTSRQVVEAITMRLSRWQRLLSRGVRRLLDDRAIRGLIGELVFLRDHLMPRYGAQAVEFWQGPERLPQDFAVGGCLFEVKTHLAGQAPHIYIASPAQLWGGDFSLYLVVIPLARCSPKSVSAVSLPSLVEELSKGLVGKPQLASFEHLLAECGYFPYPEYAEHPYLPHEPKWFCVTDDFPRITSGDIPDAIVDLKYGIRIDACGRFECKPDWSKVSEALT